MALDAQELEQVRMVIRREAEKHRGWKVAMIVFAVFAGLFMAVVLLHVLVIGGFTVYHLMAK